jgi:hypothetical protein
MTEENIRTQIDTLQRGFPYVKLHRPCTIDDGIKQMTPAEVMRFSALHTEAAQSGHLMKFVPASGAASRMFQALLNFYQEEQTSHPQPSTAAADRIEAGSPEVLRFFQDIKRFAFYDDLQAVVAMHGQSLDSFIADRRYQDVLSYLLTSKGLDYANLPKGLLKFHRYADHCRTPFEEHLVEATATVRDRHGVARLHFTVPQEYQASVAQYLDHVRPRYELAGGHFDITLSPQKPSTDTIAVDLEHRPVRDQNGQLLFRPAGHGALLENLHDLQGDIIYIKNIDNIVPDHLKHETNASARMLGGYLVALQEDIFRYLRQLEAPQSEGQSLQHIFAFARDILSIVAPEQIMHGCKQSQVDFLRQALNRPLRVCGVVRNTGEPGGGPFWVEDEAGGISLQIIETSQVDPQDPEQQAILAASTHFNPVDLVCGVRDYRGRPFALRGFRNPNTGFISLKSYAGMPLKALELPGLWNGSMAHWHTVFVEVPLQTFHPVKTVFDLLRPGHQPPE